MRTNADRGDVLGTHGDLSERLTLLANNPELEEGQRELARAWRERLLEAHDRSVAALSVAFIAQVGRGKSTLIAAATGLRILDNQDNPKKWSVLPVGDGRTTLGETRICFEARDDISLAVEPIPIDELLTEIRIFSRDLWHANNGKTEARSVGQAGEEMNDLLRQWLAPGNENPRAELNKLASATPDAESLERVLLSRIDLTQRTRRFERGFSNDLGGLTELKGALKELMLGRLPDAPAPRIVRLRVPTNDLGDEVNAVIDTRGIDADAPDTVLHGRRDLHELFADPDVLLVICSEFGAAPDMVSMSVLGLLDQPGGSMTAHGRLLRLLIVDDRQIEDDPLEQREYSLQRQERVAQCQDRLRAANLLLPDDSVLAIDARREGDVLRQALIEMAVDAREHRFEAWVRTLEDTSEALKTLQDVEFAAETREMDLRLWWVWDAAISAGPVQELDGLVALAELIAWRDPQSIKHWSHVHAAIRRRGRYHRLDLATVGARNAAALSVLRYREALESVRQFIKQTARSTDERLARHLQLRQDHFEKAVVSYFNQLAGAWYQVLSGYFTAPESNDLWSWCEARWGQGSGYLQSIASRFREESKLVRLELKGKLRPVPLDDQLPPRPALFALRKVRLRNFRCVEDRMIAITDTMTVFVGDNGLGKTCWLEAIAAAVGALLPGMDAGVAPSLSRDDIRQKTIELQGVADRQPQLPMELYVEATVQGHPLKWTRGIESLSGDTPVTEDEALQVIAQDIGREIREHSPRQLPVLAYYGTQRLWPDLEPHTERREVGSRFDGYRDSLKAASTHRHMLDWVRHYTLVELQRKKPQVQLRAIERAVIACVEGAEHFNYDLALEDLVLTMRDGQVFTLRMLSDGYRNIVAMVADIAWRASVLNPQLGDRAPALAEGVVLIDEIDLHLHPTWQRRVLSDLHRAFPRLQFIATTHSPFIIQSLRPGQLVNLDRSLEDAPYADGSPEDIAEQIMGVEVPQRSERRHRELAAAERYYTLLEQVPAADDFKLAQLKAELDEIVAPYAENQALVAFLERKRNLAETLRKA